MQIYSKIKQYKYQIISIIQILFISFLIVFFLRLTTIEFFQVPTESMESTLLTGDFVIINKLAYFFGVSPCVPLFNLQVSSNLRIKNTKIVKGDVVVFFYPMKRVAEIY